MIDCASRIVHRHSTRAITQGLGVSGPELHDTNGDRIDKGCNICRKRRGLAPAYYVAGGVEARNHAKRAGDETALTCCYVGPRRALRACGALHALRSLWPSRTNWTLWPDRPYRTLRARVALRTLGANHGNGHIENIEPFFAA